jgi:hypothetical protein
MTGKMSLVVVRSWSDCPPKVRSIAPPDDDRSVIVEPDHQGRFLTEEIYEGDPRFNSPRERAASAGAQLTKRRKSGQDATTAKEKVSNGCSGGGGASGKSDSTKGNIPIFLRRKAGLVDRNLANRHSYGGNIGINAATTGEEEVAFRNGNGTSSPEAEIFEHGGKFRVGLSGRSASTMHLSMGKVPDSLSIRGGSISSPSPGKKFTWTKNMCNMCMSYICSCHL